MTTILPARNQPWDFFGTVEMTGADPIPHGTPRAQ